MKLFLTLVSALVLMTTRSSSAVGGSKDLESLEKCQPINIEMCKGLPYDKTLFPNHLGYKNQEVADRTIVTYSPLINMKCSADCFCAQCWLQRALFYPNHFCLVVVYANQRG